MEKNQKRVHIVIFSMVVGVVGVIFLGLERISQQPNPEEYSLFDLDPIFFLVFGLVTLIVGFLLALVASAIGNKAEKAGRSWLGFFWFSALLSPIVMGIIAISLKPSDTK
jgi:uncharacterized membrane protein